MGDLRKNTNIRYVKSLNDLPAPVAGTITLSPGEWNFDGSSFFIPYNIVLENQASIRRCFCTFQGNITIQGSTEFVEVLMTYIGVGSFLYASDFQDGVIGMESANFVCPNGKVFDLTTTNPAGIVVMIRTAVLVAVDIGDLTGCLFAAVLFEAVNFGQGWTFTNNYAGISINNLRMSLGFNTPGCRFIEINGVTDNVTVVGFLSKPQSNEKVYYFNPALIYGGLNINVSPVALTEVGTSSLNIFDTGSLTQKSPRVKVVGCANIPDSTSRGNLYFQGNLTETVIDQILVPVQINATYTTGNTERFTGGSELVYVGSEPDINVEALATVGLRPVSGTNILVGAYITVTYATTYEVTFTNATNTVNRLSHGLNNGDSIRFSNSGGALPTEIREDQFYFVINAALDTFQISRTSGGAVHAFTDDGTGTHYYALGEYIDSSEANASPSSGRLFSMTTLADVTMNYGDKISVFVDNHDTTSNLIVENLQLLVAL